MITALSPETTQSQTPDKGKCCAILPPTYKFCGKTGVECSGTCEHGHVRAGWLCAEHQIFIVCRPCAGSANPHDCLIVVEVVGEEKR